VANAAGAFAQLANRGDVVPPTDAPLNAVLGVLREVPCRRIKSDSQRTRTALFLSDSLIELAQHGTGRGAAG
jgi:hypothetical protein